MATKYFSDIGIIGGTGVYDSGLFNEKKDIKVYTPFGEPSDLITIGEFAGRKVAFIPRHGKGTSRIHLIKLTAVQISGH